MKKNIFVANWKMNKTYSASLDFCNIHKQALHELTKQADIVLCPSFVAVSAMNQALKNSHVHIGAQTCSIHQKGAYTGQVDTQSLKEAGCTYGIAGHSEQRRDGYLTNDQVAHQVQRLLDASITPIICIGDTKEEFEQHQAHGILTHQLNPVLRIAQEYRVPIIIAYEPIWSIGTGIVPKFDYLQEIFLWLSQKLSREFPSKWDLLYGGSVNLDTIAMLKTIPHIDGFLIGDASLDFQKFEKIVSWKS